MSTFSSADIVNQENCHFLEGLFRETKQNSNFLSPQNKIILKKLQHLIYMLETMFQTLYSIQQQKPPIKSVPRRDIVSLSYRWFQINSVAFKHKINIFLLGASVIH